MMQPKLVFATTLACALTASACASDGGAVRSQSTRSKWIDSPEVGNSDKGVVSIAGLGVTFHTPDTLYVYRKCQEAGHSKGGPDGKWIPVIECAADGPAGPAPEDSEETEWADDDLSGDDQQMDEFDREDAGVLAPLTIYVAHKDMVINERTVETMRNRFEREGWIVDEIGYHTSYLDKPNRTGIELRVHTAADKGDAGQETRRFMFPVGDVLFIAEINYPGGTDRSGINQDWNRIVWNFQLDEDGPLYPGE